MYYVAKRVAQGALSVVLLFTFVFFAIRTIPGDPALLLAGPSASPEDVAQLRHQLGFDQSIWVQYISLAQHAIVGDFGNSVVTKVPVSSMLAARIPLTLVLIAAGLGLSALGGLGVGIVGAARRNSWLDATGTGLAVLANSIPAFWLAIVLVQIFAVHLGIFPASGTGSLAHLVLPAVVLAATQIGMIARVTRASFLDVLTADYIRVGRSKGISAFRLWSVHIARNAIVPVVTVVGLQAGMLLGGTVITETVFDWPGVGQLLIRAVLNRDYPVIQALTLVFGVAFVFVNLMVDIVNKYVDPVTRKNPAL